MPPVSSIPAAQSLSRGWPGSRCAGATLLCCQSWPRRALSSHRLCSACLGTAGIASSPMQLPGSPQSRLGFAADPALPAVSQPPRARCRDRQDQALSGRDPAPLFPHPCCPAPFPSLPLSPRAMRAPSSLPLLPPRAAAGQDQSHSPLAFPSVTLPGGRSGHAGEVQALSSPHIPAGRSGNLPLPQGVLAYSSSVLEKTALGTDSSPHHAETSRGTCTPLTCGVQVPPALVEVGTCCPCPRLAGGGHKCLMSPPVSSSCTWGPEVRSSGSHRQTPASPTAALRGRGACP